MFNTFLYGIKGQMDPVMNAAALEPPIKDYRNSLFDKIVANNTLQAVISLGNGADLAINNWPSRPTNIPWFQLTHPSAPEALVLQNWNTHLNALHAAITPDKPRIVDTTAYGVAFGPNDTTSIPREDLPFGIPEWHGTGGNTHSQRNGDKIINWSSP